MLEFVIIYFPLPSIVTLFLCVAAILLLAFLGYQLQLILTGSTTYEAFRWRDYHKQLVEVAEREEAERLGGSSGSSSSSSRAGGGALRRVLGWLGLRRRSAAAAQVQLPSNIYHRGCWANLCEVLFPERALRVAREQLKKRG
jgi:hypothetical protein